MPDVLASILGKGGLALPAQSRWEVFREFGYP